MKDVLTVTFKHVEGNGISPVFGFAFDDYASKYNKKPGDINGKRACGVILEDDDSTESVDTFIGIAVEADYDLIIFDINRPSAKLIHHVRYLDTWKEHEYEEISGVYDDRIVFGKILK